MLSWQAVLEDLLSQVLEEKRRDGSFEVGAEDIKEMFKRGAPRLKAIMCVDCISLYLYIDYTVIVNAYLCIPPSLPTYVCFCHLPFVPLISCNLSVYRTQRDEAKANFTM